MKPFITLNRHEDERVRNGHLWVFSNEIRELTGQPEPGALVEVRDAGGRFIGTGFYNAHSLIAVRIVSFSEESREWESLTRRFFEERIFRPLQMRDTGFFLSPEKAARLAPVYGLEHGQLLLKETSATSDYVRGPRKCFSGGAGLLSTTGDYTRFLQMLLNGGELDGVRLLSPKTVALMHVNHTGDKYTWDTNAFGLGFWVMKDLGYYGELGSEGAYGWGSAYYPQYLVDPQERMVALFMTQP